MVKRIDLSSLIIDRLSQILVCVMLVLSANNVFASQIINPSFESLDDQGKAIGWKTNAWGREGLNPDAIWEVVEANDAPDGKHVARATMDVNPHFASFEGMLNGLIPGRWYELSVMIRCDKYQGQGCFLAVQYNRKRNPQGIDLVVNTENLVGTRPWRRYSIQFQAPGSDYNPRLACWSAGGPGTVYFDALQISEIPAPSMDLSKRKTLSYPFWGMFTCFAQFMHQYGNDMKAAGVHWQRCGGAGLAPEQQALLEKLGMSLQFCFDGETEPINPKDPMYPVGNSATYMPYVRKCVELAGPSVRVWEVSNEPNTRLGWTLPAYANQIEMISREVKSKRPDAVIATGGLATYISGYVGGLLNEGLGPYLDMILIHPYGVDEGLDSQLYMIGKECAAHSRPDMAIAINETGWPTTDPDTGYTDFSWFVSEQEQSSNIVKMHIQALAHRLSFVTYLGWNDITMSDMARNMGLVKINGTPKPSYHAYKFMTSLIGDRRMDTWTYSPQGTRVYKLGSYSPVWVVWNALQDSDVTVDVGKQQVYVCDIYGKKLTATPATGSITLKAIYEPTYLIPTDLMPSEP